MHFFPAALASFLALTSALTINHPRSDRLEQTSPGHLIHQFPDPTWVENIAVRRNGQLLVTIVTAPELYLIDPLISALDSTSNKTTTLIHSFAPSFKAVLGITETQLDQFYVIVGDLSLAPPIDAGLGTYTVWSVNLQQYDTFTNTGAAVHQVAALTSAGLLNGMSTLSASQDLIILADSVYGAIWLVDTKTGNFSILLQEPEMAPPTGQLLDINGVRVLSPTKGNDTVYIYFDNDGAKTFYRVPFSLSTMQKLGPVETLFSGYAVDDFALDERSGSAYLAGSSENSLLRVSLDGGEVESIYGGVNDTILLAPTSVALGRGWDEKGFVYVTTSGEPSNMNFTEGGKIVAVGVGKMSLESV
jgi:hypothetical protein